MESKYDIKRFGFPDISYGRLKAYNEYANNNNMEQSDYIENCWNLAEYKFEMWNDEYCVGMSRDLYQYLVEKQMICLAYSSQCKGYFQKFVMDGHDSINDFLRTRVETKRNLRKAIYIRDYCMQYGLSPTAVILGYITSKCD